MPKVLILCAHRPGRSPSQRYRFEQYLDFLKNNGFDFTWSYLLNEVDDKIFYSPGHFLDKVKIILRSIATRKKDAATFSMYDIIFIQREAHFLGNSRFERKAFKSGAKVIFDFDDSIWIPDTSPGNAKWAWLKKAEKFFDNIKYAHVVIAGNPFLAEKASFVNKNTVIIPTTINCDWHIPKHELRHKEKVCIGWSGSISTIKHFEMLLPVLKKIKEKYLDKVQFRIIGQENYLNSELEVKSVQWSEKTEVDELNRMDIGLMPLPDDEWANGKCGLKGLSYMACGIPTIMSKVGVNKMIIENGLNGYLAVTEEDWYRLLCLLIEDIDLRVKIGELGRKTVLEKYSVEKNKAKYLEIFQNPTKQFNES
ncbi:MAG TPA: glycosyltransferase family 4 protein [Bacteroidia bacterium]|nr:glycosyltransferase family 4 protein [Bacteroidia bacterium]